MGVIERRDPRHTWVWFSVLRIGIFAVVLAVLLLVLPVEPWISTIVAAIIAFCISFIFLSRPRAELSSQLVDLRNGKRPPTPTDDDAEDAAMGDVRG
jgi:hypothetical protein